MSSISTHTGEKKKLSFAYQLAEENLKTAKAEVKEAEKNYGLNLGKSKLKLLEEKYKDYESAKISCEEVRLDNEISLTEAQEAAEEAFDTLAELENTDGKISELLEKYKREREKEQEDPAQALTELYRMAYGGESEYETHQEDVVALERKLKRTKEDAKRLKKIYKETNEEEGDSDAAKQAYKEAKREEEDAAENLTAAVKKEERILDAAEDYVQAVQSNNTEEVSASLEAVRKGVYGASGYEKHKKDKVAAEKKLQQAKKKEKDVADKNALSLKAVTEKLILLEHDIESLNNGTYDFEEEALKLEAEIEEAQEKVKTANIALKEASVNLEADKLDNEAEAEQRNEEKENVLLKQEALQLDLEEKEEEFQKLNDLKENGGLLKSQVSGRMGKISVEAGKTAGIEDTAAVSVGDYGVVVKFTGEQGDYIATGDKMELFLKGNKDKITVKVQGIRFSKDEQGNEQTEVAAALPEGNYIPGSSMKAVISKSSELYDICVPIEAIREDALGSYVLITNPYNTPLGEELLTVRVAVEVLDKDAGTAAVNGTLTKEDQVIVSSSRELGEGERVRLEADQ